MMVRSEDMCGSVSLDSGRQLVGSCRHGETKLFFE